MTSKSKGHFTLLEVLVVFSILAFGLGITGVKIHQLYSQQKFLSEAEQLLSHLKMANELMLILDADITFHLRKLNHPSTGYEAWLDVEKPLDASSQKAIQRRLRLTSIKKIQLGQKTEGPFSILFTIGEKVETAVRLFEGEGKATSYLIELKGYPDQIIGKLTTKEKEIAASKETKELLPLSKKLYPQEVYEEIFQENEAAEKNKKKAFSAP